MFPALIMASEINFAQGLRSSTKKQLGARVASFRAETFLEINFGQGLRESRGPNHAMGPFHVKARGGMSFFPISRRMNDMSVHLLCQNIICH